MITYVCNRTTPDDEEEEDFFCAKILRNQIQMRNRQNG